MKWTHALFFTLILLVCSACNRGSARAVLAFENSGDARDVRRATTSAPTIFAIKLIAAYITEDIDPDTGSNVGNTAMIYLNPECDDDIMHCDISAGTAEDGDPMSHIIEDFFDFALPTDDVNSALNAQGRSIDAGTYKYARLEFCKYNSGNSENIKWGDATVGEQTFKRNSCTINSAEFDPAITVAAGEAVTVTLSYDFSTAIQTGADATGDDCEGSGATQECFTLPTFTPSATKSR